MQADAEFLPVFDIIDLSKGSVIMKKMIMPAVFSLIFLAFVAMYIFVILVSATPLMWKIIVGGLLVAVAAVMVFVFIQRFRELKEEEKDDLSKY